MPKIRSTSSKESRLSIRVDPARKAVIARAAKQRGHTISDFVLEYAYQMATELLADEGTIALSKKQVAHILKCSITRRPGASRPFASCLPSNSRCSIIHTTLRSIIWVARSAFPDPAKGVCYVWRWRHEAQQHFGPSC